MSAPARTRSIPPFAPGAEPVPGYEVIEHLRRGNDLDVYDAWSRARMTRCVIKAVRPDRRHKQRVCEALQGEGELLERLAHTHIVRAYATFAEPPLIVLETLPGATLTALVDDEGPLPAAAVAHLGLQLGAAVHHLHGHGVLHLDLKPSNVIAHAGAAKLIDLSLARPPGPAHAGIGTWGYMAPEQACGGELTEAADVWGLGATLFEAATGEGPFDDDPDAGAPLATASGTYSEAEADRHPQLERRARTPDSVVSVGPELTAAITSALHPNPQERPSLAALLATLEPIAELPDAEQRWARLALSR